MEKRLPNGWILSRLEQVSTKPQYGWTCKATQSGTLRLLRTTDISSGHVDWDAVPFCSEHPKQPSDYYLKRGDILVSRAGSVGKSFLIKQDVNNAVFASYLVRFKPLIDSDYIYFFMQSRYYWNQIEEKSAGIALPNVNASKLSQIELPLAPLNEQRRIVSKIEELFSRLDEGEAALHRVQRLLISYRQAVLKAAVTGELTKEWREANRHHLESGADLLQRILKSRHTQPRGRGQYQEPHSPELSLSLILPHGWTWASVDQICNAIVDCPHSTPKWTEEGVICVRTTEFTPGKLVLESVRYVSEDTYAERIARLEPQEGDILYSREGGILGIACTVPPGIRLCLGQRMMLMRASISGQYLTFVLNSPLILGSVQNKIAGSASPHINVGDIKRFAVPFPSAQEQEEISGRLDDIFSRIDALEAWCSTELTRSATLRQSILKAAFSGQLVEQDPSDEPASALLQRIRATRQTPAIPQAKGIRPPKQATLWEPT